MIEWPEAIARLAGERTRAEALVRALKNNGSTAQQERGALIYAEAKAEVDAVVSGLLVALDQRATPMMLPNLEARIKRSVERTVELRDFVEPLLPLQTGAKEAAGVGDILGKVVEALFGPLVDAVSALWKAQREDNALTRATIRTQLEATRWPDFASVA